MFGYWKGHTHGYDKGRLEALREFERILAVLREELGDERGRAEAASARADAACDLLLGHLGARAISEVGVQREVEREERHVDNVRQLASIPDPTMELPYGDPRGTFASEHAARVDLGEDVAVLTNG